MLWNLPRLPQLGGGGDRHFPVGLILEPDTKVPGYVAVVPGVAPTWASPADLHFLNTYKGGLSYHCLKNLQHSWEGLMS